MNIVILLIAVLGINIIAIVSLLLVKRFKERNMDNFEKEFKVNKDYKESKSSMGKIEPRHYAIAVIYLTVIVIVGYLLIGSVFPNTPGISGGSFMIDAESSLLGDSLSSFYVNPSSVLGEKIVINGQSLRPIISQQSFGLVLKPKTVISGNSTGTLEINFLVNNGEGSEVYLNDNLIIPNMQNYELIASYPDKNVYVKKTLLEYYDKSSLQPASDAGNFIYENFPGASVYTQVPFNQSIPNLKEYKQETNTIPTTFRGDLKLAVYADSYLNVKFVKQDLNSYLGDDEYIVNISDINGKSYFTKTYGDDGDRKNTNKLGAEQEFEIELGSLPRGVYIITFTKDKNNDAPDSTLKNIRINSNKILISGTILPINAFEFYTEVFVPKTIGFYYWWDNKNQTIQISGTENKNINLDKEWLSKTYTQNLTKPGEYNLKTNVGYLWVYPDYLSINKNTWFDMPSTNNPKFTGQDIVISDKNSLSISGNSYSYKKVFSVDEIKNIKIKVLDPNRIYLKDIKFTI